MLGCDLREVCAAVHRAVSAPRRAELPRHCHPQGHEPGGETLQVADCPLLIINLKK